jgi:hypothetical protein
MTRLRQALGILLIVSIIFSFASCTALADEDASRLIDPKVVITAEILDSPEPEPVEPVDEGQETDEADAPKSAPAHTLLVQATSWLDQDYYYVLTLTNLTPWPISAPYILDRYLPADPEQPEILREWYPDALAPGDSASIAFRYAEGPLDDACHQIEISIADGMGTVLMDCSKPGSTTVWDVAMTEPMETFLGQPALTMAAPSGGSKVGIHVTRNSDPRIMAFVESAAPSIVVAVGDLGWLTHVKEVSPSTITVGRIEEGDQSFNGDPIQRARDFVALNAETYHANPGVDYWLGWNEPVIDEVWQMEWYAQFEAERTRAMAELGYKTAIGNFSAGTPEAHEFEAFLPAIAVAHDLGGVLALHEYSAPTMRDGVGAGIPGLAASDSSGALTLRYRFWYDHYLKPNDLVIPLLITEAGIDGGVLRYQDVNLFGWRDFSKELPEPLEESATEPLSDAEYLQQLSWYDDELRRDEYVLGFAIFNVGDHGGRWHSFDMTDMLPDLGHMIVSKQ